MKVGFVPVSDATTTETILCYLLFTWPFQDDVVAQTKIVYQEKELLQLIHSHLAAKGLSKTAVMLQQEADLPRCTNSAQSMPVVPQIFSPCSSSKIVSH